MNPEHPKDAVLDPAETILTPAEPTSTAATVPARSPIPTGLAALYPLSASAQGIPMKEVPKPPTTAEITTRWSYLMGSATGSGHLKVKLGNQDAWMCRLLLGQAEREVLMLAVADGAGSAEYALEGAQTCVEAFTDYVTRTLTSGATMHDLDPAGLLMAMQDALKTAAEDRPLREYACTFTAAVLGTEQTLLFQIGDGFMVIANGFTGVTEGDKALSAPAGPGTLELGFVPHQGEYINATTFVSTATVVDIQAKFIPTPQMITVSSDGLYRLAVELKTLTPHAPFYPPFFAAVTEPGYNAESCTRLSEYLASGTVQSKTDDDVTLLVARRL